MNTNWIDQLRLPAIDAEPGATVALASVPVPREGPVNVRFKGVPSHAVTLARWPGVDGPGAAKRLLVVGVSDKPLSDQITLESGESTIKPATLPAWRVGILEEKKTGVSMREVNELVITHAGREIGLRLGIEKADGPRWWEWLTVEEEWAGPSCKAIHAAGYVSTIDVTDETFNPARYNSCHWFHRQHWLFCEVRIWLFSNGLARVTARHVNNRFFDQGRDLEDVVPVLGFRTVNTSLNEKLDGQRHDFALGNVQLDIARSTHLVSAEHPGKLATQNGVVIYQPYTGAEIELGEHGTPAVEWRLASSERRMWKGMARTVEFDLSLADAPIRTRRFVAPQAWLAYCGALWPDGALPARGPLNETADRMVDFAMASSLKPSGRFYEASSGGDGEHSHGLMRGAYRTRRRDLYDAAIRHAYACADIGMDHADFTIFISGQVRGAISLVLQRVIGMLAAYLENGDPYLLECAEAVADTAYAIDRSNWPRRSYGRDAAYIRSLTHLYEVTGERFYLRRAGAACRRAAQCQTPAGYFTDQGGAVGAHGHLNEIVKPWMNSILTEAFVDYLERAGSDPVVENAVRRVGEWLLKVQLTDADGVYWAYELAWGQNTTAPYQKWKPDKPPEKHPVGDMHLDYNARTLLWLSKHTGDPRFARAWQGTYERFFIRKKQLGGVYGGVKTAENYPWHEAHLWNARWTPQGVVLDPMLDLINVGREATIELPLGGQMTVLRTAAGVETKTG